MLARIGAAALRWAAASPWTNVYGLARSLLALGTALTLATTPTSVLFTATTGRPVGPNCVGPAGFGLFCVVPIDRLELVRLVAVVLLAVAASGWRPRLTAIPHWWVSFSVATSASVIDGGDHVTQVLTLLMLPVALTDSRRWHWEADGATGSATTRLIALSALTAIRIQVAGIYAQAAIAKLAVPEWVDGTVMYYWLTDPTYGAPGWLQPIVMPLITTGFVAVISWSVLALEFALAFALVATKRIWPYLLAVGVLFHVFIAVFLGLVTFGLAMSAALIVYLRPAQEAFALPRRLVEAHRAIYEARASASGAAAAPARR